MVKKRLVLRREGERGTDGHRDKVNALTYFLQEKIVVRN